MAPYKIACGINLHEVGLLGHTFNPSPVDSDSSPRWWCTDVGAVFGAADGLQSLTLLYDTRERSSQSLAVTKRWTVLSPAASFFLAKKGRDDNLLNYTWWSVENGWWWLPFTKCTNQLELSTKGQGRYVLSQNKNCPHLTLMILI